MAERTVRDSALSAAEKLVMLSLLSRAENEDCTLPARYTPTERQLAGNASLSLLRVKDVLRHLRRHGWLDVRPGRGRPPLDKRKKTLSRRSFYILFPGSAPEPCGPDCPGIDRKRTAKKDAPAHPITQKKDAPAHPVKDASASEFSQVNGTNALKGRDEGGMREGAPDCAVCGTPMDPVLPAAGYRTHPCCDPDEKPDRSTNTSPRRAA